MLGWIRLDYVRLGEPGSPVHTEVRLGSQVTQSIQRLGYGTSFWCNCATLLKISENEAKIHAPVKDVDKESKKQDGIHCQGPTPPWRLLYLIETKSWWCGEGEEKVSILTHTTARGMGKKHSTIIRK